MRCPPIPERAVERVLERVVERDQLGDMRASVRRDLDSLAGALIAAVRAA